LSVSLVNLVSFYTFSFEGRAMADIRCDLCGGPTIYWLDTREDTDYPAARVFTCQRCGHVMWQKRPTVQQQQQQPQPQPPKRSGVDATGEEDAT
jgi:hypothetical protein